MSQYIERYCRTHGDWDMDVDNPGECPECEAAGMTRVQVLERRCAAAEARAERYREALRKIVQRDPLAGTGLDVAPETQMYQIARLALSPDEEDLCG